MPGDIPPLLTFTWLLATLALQTGCDAFFTRGILPPMTMRSRVQAWASVNAGVVFLLVLIMRLAFVPLDMYLLWSREQGTLALAVLVAVALYFVWAVPFVLGRGWLMLHWKGLAISDEKRHDYWGYVWAGSVVTVFFNGFLYVAYAIVLPLMQGVPGAFGG